MSRPGFGEGTSGLAELFPEQGDWTVSEYLRLDTNRRVEFSDGYLEVLPVPTTTHQLIVLYLLRAITAFVEAGSLGQVSFAGTRVRIRSGKFREPDVVFMAADHESRIKEQYWKGADLVMEVLSEDRDLDLVKKRREYARAGIPEYWIIDPLEARITVLRLSGQQYVEHGRFAKGTRATSALLRGFSVEVSKALARRGTKGD